MPEVVHAIHSPSFLSLPALTLFGSQRWRGASPELHWNGLQNTLPRRPARGTAALGGVGGEFFDGGGGKGGGASVLDYHARQSRAFPHECGLVASSEPPPAQAVATLPIPHPLPSSPLHLLLRFVGGGGLWTPRRAGAPAAALIALLRVAHGRLWQAEDRRVSRRNGAHHDRA